MNRPEPPSKSSPVQPSSTADTAAADEALAVIEVEESAERLGTVNKPSTEENDDDAYSPPEEVQADEVMEEPEAPNILIPEVPESMRQPPQEVSASQPQSMPEALAQASVGSKSPAIPVAWCEY